MAEVVYRTAGAADLIAVGRVYLRAFGETLEQFESPDLSPMAMADVAGACMAAEPDCIGVAEVSGEVVGYIIAILDVRRIRRTALLRGLPLIWLWRWVTGQYRLTVRAVRHIIADKLSFWRAAKLPGAGCPRVLSMAVDPEWQRRGIGRGLLPAAIERLRAKECTCVRLEVRPGNEAARRLYEGFGFAPAGRFEDSRGPWDVMLLELDERE
ncbi:MAG: GNAT family N-acetyltransferase [Armatimonadota bacterium]|jgi:GNAT superfamily N-acetyltransferase